MARRTGMSQSAISRIWRPSPFNLIAQRPSNYPPTSFHRPRHRTVPQPAGQGSCVDEKSGIQALDRTALPMRPGQVERRTHDYSRHGTTDLFAALDVTTGKVIGSCQRRHRSVEFRSSLTRSHSVPPDLDVHIILDNSSTHKTARPPLPSDFTPTSSRLNLVERWFAALTEKQLPPQLRKRSFNTRLPAPIPSLSDGQKRDEILASLARYCTRTYDSGH